MRGIGGSSSIPPTPTSRVGQVLEEGIGFGFAASGKPPATSAEVPREPKVVGIISALEASGPTGPFANWLKSERRSSLLRPF
ncbi:hypothetical protein Nepgr_024333 [Nepenthes gracilis]|uniref:Uncharacterized protein n=1 Tax=Nepenthes gracilis TaxID=150966 RepID=A0AAD3T2W8_NEPGR|nr:hypothetical protein Nepgr_024333 [Nepenthes gracilis]